MCVWAHLHFDYQELETSEGRVRKVLVGAVMCPTGINALTLLGSYLTSTWISFDSRSEGDEIPVRLKLKLFWKKQL